MSRRVGLAIAHDTMRAVVVQGTTVVWAGAVSREAGAPAADDVVALLARAPLRRLRRTRVAAVVGPHASQLKRITGLPAVTDPEILAAVVRENACTFFLQNGTPLAVTGIRMLEPGTVWSAAIDATHVTCVRQACDRLRLRLCSIAPAAAVLPLGVSGEHFQWLDGPVTLELVRSDGQLVSVRRVSAAAGNGTAPPEAVPALAPLGERAEQFADAYGAAVAAAGDPLTLGPRGDVPWERRRFRRRVLPPSIAALVAAAALLLSPLYPATIARRAESTLRAIHGSEAYQLAGEVLPQLERVTAVLAELERFAAYRPHRTRLLAQLATALPDSAAIVRLDVTNQEARMVVLGRSAPQIVAAVEAIPGVTSVTHAAQVVRQNLAGTELDRITLTFQHHHEPTREPTPAGVR